MDEFAYFHQMDVPTLIHVGLFMMLWVGGIVAIDMVSKFNPQRVLGAPDDPA